MIIINCNKGRLGNSIFRLMANIVFLIVYDMDGQIIYHNSSFEKIITDNYFNQWSANIINGKIDSIDKNSKLMFDGYYQHDKIYSLFRSQIIEYIKTHPNLLLLTHFSDKYKAHDLIHTTTNKNYDIVVHVRLEDFLEINQVLNPLTICKILDEIVNDNNNICFVLNKPVKEIELNYIEFFRNKYNIIVESNDPITDFHIMKNAKILVCSYSTLSWCAAFFSDIVKQVYLPNYNISLHQTFKTLDHVNVTLFDCNFCTYEKLNSIINSTLNHTKSYSLTDCLGKPIDLKLDELFNKKTNGFYIELGAFDGLTQSNTAFFEFYRNWRGILIEPSLGSFTSCLTNRPKSYTVNACCVSNDYTEDNISGDFNNITMASVNGLRLKNTSNLVQVKAMTLEKILDDYFSKNGEKEIDFVSIDTEGYELEVIKGLNLNKYKPTYLLIEIYANQFNNICEFLNNCNYKLHSNLTNYNKNNNPIWDGTHNDYLFIKK